ncbi:hypothetical protein Tco_0786831 [Tanacetum coccineum]
MRDSDQNKHPNNLSGVKDKPQFGVVLLRNRRVLVVILLGVLNKVSAVKDKASVDKAPVVVKAKADINKEKAHVVKVPVAKDKDKDKAPADVFVNDKAPTDVVNEIQVCHKDIVLALFLYKSNKNVIGLISRN